MSNSTSSARLEGEPSAAPAASHAVVEKPRLVPVPSAAPAPAAEAPQGAVPPAAESVAAAKPKSRGKRLVAGILLVAAIGAAGYYGRNWYSVGRFEVSTNDAYVRSDMSQVGAKAAGYVATIPVAENAHVNAGDVILTLDDGDYQLAVEAARKRIETQRALIAGFDSQVTAQNAQVDVAQAKLASAQAEVAASTATLNRLSPLVRTRVATPQSLDDATSRVDAAKANVVAATAGIAAAKAQLDVIAANRAQAEKALAELETALAKAERDLTFTQVHAPYSGIVANRAVEAGQYVQPGQRLMALVPDNSSYIEANFKETQIAQIHPGQKAAITVDAFASQTFEGRVDSISPASGAEFSLLPPENATGNFTKITQRIPVHVKIPAELAGRLTPGMSVTVTVDERDAGSTAGFATGSTQ